MLHVRPGRVHPSWRKLGLTAGTVAFALAAFLTCATVSGSPQWTNVQGVKRPAPQVFPMENDNAIGDAAAPVRIDEYGDFQCYYCKQFVDQTEAKLIDQYVVPGKVYFVFHSMGNFVSQHMRMSDTRSEDAAMAAYAAGDQNMFWQYHDVLFANQQDKNSRGFTPATLKKFAEALGLDMAKFDEDFSSQKYLARVQSDEVDGKARGVTATPTFFVNGKKLVGPQPLAKFKAAIDEALVAATQ